MRKYENLKQTSENRLAQRSYYIPKGKSEYMLLNGLWRFKFYEKELDIPKDITGWDEIQVPSCWQLKGYENPNYSNVNYPYPIDPPYVPDDNPCGIYERDFTLDEKWGKIYFVLEGVSSCGFVYLNGEYIGFTQGSHLQAEFDITHIAKKGKNTLRVQVYKWCVGSYLEDQDFFRFNGIFRDCYILQRPVDHITDVLVKTKDNNKIIAEFDKAADVCLLDDKGGVLGEKSGVSKVEFTLDNPILWNCEKPYLYTLKITRDGEIIEQKVGIRTIAVSDEYELLINGVSVKLHGVNHHDTHPKTGWYETDEDLRHDLEVMKELNINCVRTSHYPPTPKFIEMCDEMGMYVVLETDIETHGFLRRKPNVPYGFDVEDMDWPATNHEWLDEHIERMQRAVERDKNHPSIIMWSTGNESGHGPNHVAMVEWLRSRDDDRLVHCEDASRKGEIENSDVYSRMYPDFKSVRGFAEREDIKMPVFLCEYAHSMGNGPGDVYEYNEIFDEYKKTIGGCVWEWADHTVLVDGVPKYGGDFNGELTHDGNFCCDGMVFYDRTIKAGSLEVKAAYQPIRTRYEDGKLYIYNRRDFTDLNEFEFEYVIEVDGKEVKREKAVLSAAPHTEAVLDIDFKNALCEFGAYIICRLFKEGREVAISQHTLPFEVKVEEENDPLVDYTEDENNYFFKGEDFEYTFSKYYGVFTSMVVNGKELFAERPFISAWRAPTDNDRKVKNFWGAYTIWQGDNLNRSFSKVYSCSVENGVITVSGSIAGVSRKPCIHHTAKYSVYKSGKVDVYVSATVREDAYWLPRFGFEFNLPQSSKEFTYFGRGPIENYRDMCHASYISRFNSNADKEYVNYIYPQEHGNHIDVKELCVGGLKFKSAKGMEINVSNYSADALDKAEHINQIEYDSMVHVRVDYKVSGIGSNSCGPELDEKYRLAEKEFEYSFSMEPNR